MSSILMWTTGISSAVIIFVVLLFFITSDHHASPNVPKPVASHGYYVFDGQTAEPYNGTPKSVVDTTGTNSEPCRQACDDDEKCIMFSLHPLIHKCFLYDESKLLEDSAFEDTPIVAPSNTNSSVYVKSGEAVIEFLTSFHNPSMLNSLKI